MSVKGDGKRKERALHECRACTESLEKKKDMKGKAVRVLERCLLPALDIMR